MRTELGNRMRVLDSNALASSIVLVCRLRPADATLTTRRDFLQALKRELPRTLKDLQRGNIAPVDLAQAAIGPGMAVFSRYSKVLESDGTPMRVRTALQLINQTLDEVLVEQEGEYDAAAASAAARWVSASTAARRNASSRPAAIFAVSASAASRAAIACLFVASASSRSLAAAARRSSMIAITGRNRNRLRIQMRMRTLTVSKASVCQSIRISKAAYLMNGLANSTSSAMTRQ